MGGSGGKDGEWTRAFGIHGAERARARQGTNGCYHPALFLFFCQPLMLAHILNLYILIIETSFLSINMVNATN
jgi:hypothetical protein